ncbi:MAG: zinc metalloprotease HtpX [Candidatus Omnitrophota bacterium]|nr:zinc metalloprotease HtpX [Candidatus Omnitrophota bacterium]
MNYFKTTLLLIALAALLIWIGSMVGGMQGAMIAFIFTLILNVGSFWFSDKIVLAMYRAQEMPEKDFPEVYEIVREIAGNAGIPQPKVYLIPQDAPNAFATGRSPKNGVVCVTRGILNMLNRGELKGVVAHEMSHIKNRDTLIMTVTAVLASTIMMLVNMARWTAMFGGRDDRNRNGGGIVGLLAMSILAPLAAMLIQLAISRSREYGADAAGAKVAGSGNGLANALRKLNEASPRYRLNASPQTAHLFIVNPLSGSFIAGLFSTHPPVEERIKRLMKA